MADMKLMKELMETIRQKENGPQPYDTTAEVVRVDGGTAWVSIPGGEGETPVQMSINARPGDTVRVRVTGGQAWLVGNDTAPPTDDTVANEALLKVNEIEASKIIANLIEAGTINADWITTGSLSADRIYGGTLKLGGESGKNGHLYLYNQDDEVVAFINENGFTYYAEPAAEHMNTDESVRIDSDDGSMSLSGVEYGISLEGEYFNLSSRLRKALLEIYGWRGTRTDGQILPTLVYQENPLFSVEALVTKGGPNDGGDGVAIDFCEELQFYRNPTSSRSETPLHTEKILTIDTNGISMESGKTVDGVDISELASKHTFTGAVNSIQYGVTNDGYPYLRWIYSNGDQYQIVTSATGIAFEKRPSGGSWSTLWTK